MATNAQPISGNYAFNRALRKHLAKLKPAQKASFTAAYNDLSPGGLLKSVRDFDAEQKATCKHHATVEKVFNIVEQLMRSITIGIQSNPELSSLVVGATRLVIDMGLQYATFLPKLVGMLSELSQYLGVLDLFVERMGKEGAPESSLVMKSVANIYGDWLNFCREVQKVFVDKHGGLRRLVSIRIFLRVQWEPFEASFGPIKERFKENLQLLLHSSQAVQYNDMFAILEKIDAARSSQEERDVENTRRDFMQWISTIDFDEDHQRISSRRHPGTGDWLIQRPDFKSWEESSTSQLLWCYGKPGCGKSVLASHTLEHISWKAASNEQIGLAFCYFNYKRAEYQGPRQILSAFIKQLCWCKPVIPMGLLGFYRKHILDARTPSYESMEEALSTMIDEFDEVYLVVDALDECKLELREQIIQSLVEVSASHPQVRTFVTSQPEVDIKHMFRRLNSPSVCIEARNTAEDIRKYVIDSVDSLRGTDKLHLQREATATLIVETLRIDRDVLAELYQLPPDLNSTYYRILTVIEELPPSLRDLAQRSLMLVFYAARPLQAVELIDLAAVTAGFDDMQRSDMHRYTRDDILEACANLLVEDEGVIRPSHFSVQEYFTSSQSVEEQFSKYFVSPFEGQSKVSTACLRYLFFDFLKGGVCRTEFSLIARLQRFPSARYSAQYFDHHLAALEDYPTDLLDRLFRLLEQPSRSISAILQLRYTRKGSYTGVLSGDFDSMDWEVPATFLLALTKLRTTQLSIYSQDSLELFEDIPYALHLACLEGLESVFRDMVNDGWSVHRRSRSGLTLFFYGVKGGSAAICLQLTNSKDSEGWESRAPDFHVAFIPGNETLLRMLVTATQNDRIISKIFEFAVQENAQAALWTVVDTLKADGRMQPSFITSILPELARRGRYDLAAMLERTGCLESSTTVNATNSDDQLDKALQWCCVRCDLRFTELLLNLGADSDKQIDHHIWEESSKTNRNAPKDEAVVTHFRRNTLCLSLWYQNKPMMELLLTHGAKLFYADGKSFDPNSKTLKSAIIKLNPRPNGSQMTASPSMRSNEVAHEEQLQTVNEVLSSLGMPQLNHLEPVSHASAVVHFLLTSPYSVSRDTVVLLAAYDVIPNYSNHLWRVIMRNSRSRLPHPKPYVALEDIAMNGPGSYWDDTVDEANDAYRTYEFHPKLKTHKGNSTASQSDSDASTLASSETRSESDQPNSKNVIANNPDGDEYKYNKNKNSGGNHSDSDENLASFISEDMRVWGR